MGCLHYDGVYVMLGGPERRILVQGKVYLFEMHPYCGPVLLRQDGEPRARQFTSSNKPFWDAVTLWAQQGEAVGEDGFCVYSGED